MTISHYCPTQGCYRDTLPDWAMLDGCFGKTTVKAGDIDGFVHQNGRCLFLEKKFPNGFLADPQLRMIVSLVNQGNSFIVLWCEEPLGRDIFKMQVFGIGGYDPEVIPASLEDFRGAVKIWWKATYVPGRV